MEGWRGKGRARRAELGKGGLDQDHSQSSFMSDFDFQKDGRAFSPRIASERGKPIRVVPR